MGQFNFNSQPAPWSLNWLQQFLYSLQRSWWARCSTTVQLWLPQSTTPSTTPHPPPTPLHPHHMPQNLTTLLPTPTVTQKLHPSALRAATFHTVSSTLVHHRGEVVSLSASVHPPPRVAALHVLSGRTSGLALCRKAGFRIGRPSISQVLRSSAATNVGPVDNDIVVTIRPALLMLDSQGVEQLVNSDLQGNTAVLLKPNFVSPTPG